jgi:hypothetical protein
MAKKSFLAPDSVDVTLTIAGTAATTLAPFTKLKATMYGGQPLYCHAQSNGDTLSIVIDDIQGLDVSDMGVGLPPAAGVDVTFAFNGSIVNHWTKVAIPYSGVQPLNFSAKLDSSLTKLHFLIDDTARTLTTTKTDGQVSFILVQQHPGADVQIHWVKTDNIVIGDTEKLVDGSVVLPAPPPPKTGGVTGPMGFMTP